MIRRILSGLLLVLVFSLPASVQESGAQESGAQTPGNTPSGPGGGLKVDLELILMADGSGSVEEDEFLLQRRGYARALRHPRVIKAIQSGQLGRIALSYVEWSGPILQVPIVSWTLIGTSADLAKVAKKLETHPRELEGGGTAVGNAILYGAHSINSNGFSGKRRVIDISGDGPDKDGVPASIGRDQAVVQGITINGLPIIDGRHPMLEIFFIDNVIGGPGAFSIAAKGFKSFYSAILTKLIREIASLPKPKARQAAANR